MGSWGPLGPPWNFLGRLGGVLGASWGSLGRVLAGSWGGLGASWGAFGRSWAAPGRQGRKIAKKTRGFGPTWGHLGVMLGPCWRHFGTMLGYFAVSCGAAREGQKNKMKICNQDAILKPSLSHVGPIWEVCWVVLWCHMVCGVALCCDKRLTFVNVTIVRFT